MCWQYHQVKSLSSNPLASLYGRITLTTSHPVMSEDLNNIRIKSVNSQLLTDLFLKPWTSFLKFLSHLDPLQCGLCNGKHNFSTKLWCKLIKEETKGVPMSFLANVFVESTRSFLKCSFSSSFHSNLTSFTYCKQSLRF